MFSLWCSKESNVLGLYTENKRKLKVSYGCKICIQVIDDNELITHDNQYFKL